MYISSAKNALTKGSDNKIIHVAAIRIDLFKRENSVTKVRKSRRRGLFVRNRPLYFAEYSTAGKINATLAVQQSETGSIAREAFPTRKC